MFKCKLDLDYQVPIHNVNPNSQQIYLFTQWLNKLNIFKKQI